MQGILNDRSDEGLLFTLKLMEEAFEENPQAFGGLAGSLSQVCEHAARRLNELLDMTKPRALN